MGIMNGKQRLSLVIFKKDFDKFALMIQSEALAYGEKKNMTPEEFIKSGYNKRLKDLVWGCIVYNFEFKREQ